MRTRRLGNACGWRVDVAIGSHDGLWLKGSPATLRAICQVRQRGLRDSTTEQPELFPIRAVRRRNATSLHVGGRLGAENARGTPWSAAQEVLRKASRPLPVIRHTG